MGFLDERGKKLTQKLFSCTHKETQTHTWTDINGAVRNMYTHTKEKKKNTRPLDFSSYLCVYLAAAQGYMSCLPAQPCLGTEMFHTSKRERESHERLHFFHRRLPKVGNQSEKSKHKWSREATRNNRSLFFFFQEWVYLSALDYCERKVRLSTG